MMDSNWLLLKSPFPSDLSINEELKQWCFRELPKPRFWLVSFYIWWHLLNWQEIPVLSRSHPLVSSADDTVLRRLKYLRLRSHSDTVWSCESEHLRSKRANVQYQFIPIFFILGYYNMVRKKLRTCHLIVQYQRIFIQINTNLALLLGAMPCLNTGAHFLGQISPSLKSDPHSLRFFDTLDHCKIDCKACKHFWSNKMSFFNNL